MRKPDSLYPCRICRKPVRGGNCPKHPLGTKAREYGPGWSAVRRAILGPSGTAVCAYCERMGTTVDHVIPRSRVLDEGQRFGLHDPNALDNLLPCCERCNSSKKDLSLTDWCRLGLAPEPAYEVLEQRQRANLPH